MTNSIDQTTLPSYLSPSHYYERAQILVHYLCSRISCQIGRICPFLGHGGLILPRRTASAQISSSPLFTLGGTSDTNICCAYSLSQDQNPGLVSGHYRDAPPFLLFTLRYTRLTTNAGYVRCWRRHVQRSVVARPHL